MMRLLVVPILVSLLAAGPSEAQVVKAAALSVFDANGKRVGPMMSTILNRWAVVALRVDGMPVVLNVFPNHFEGSETAILYDDFGCTGQAYLPQELDRDEPIVPLTAVSPPGNTLWLQASQTREVIVPKSILRGFGQSDPGRCEEGPFSPNPGFRATIAVDLFTKFTPPFRTK